jgi:hypothetical protein
MQFAHDDTKLFGRQTLTNQSTPDAYVSLWIYENKTSHSPSPFGKPEERSTYALVT